MTCYNCKHGGWTIKVHLSIENHNWADGFLHHMTAKKARNRNRHVFRRHFNQIFNYNWASKDKGY